MNLVKTKRSIEYKIAVSEGKLRKHFKKWTLDLDASWMKYFDFILYFFLSIYVYSLFDIINLAPMSIILCSYELGGVCVCVLWVHVCLDVGLGREGPGLGLLFFLCCLWVGVGICLEKCPVIWDILFYCSPFCMHSIIGAFGSMVGKIFGLGLCNSCCFSAPLFGIMLHPFLPLQVIIFQGPSTFTTVHLSIYFSFFDDIEYYAPCSRL